MNPSDYVLSNSPQIGDYVITYGFAIGIVTKLYGDDEYLVFVMEKQKHNIYTNEDIWVVDKEIIPYIKHISKNMKMNLLKLEPEDDFDYLYNYKTTIIRRLRVIDDYFNRNLTRKVQNFVLRNNIKKIIGREKSNGNRIVELKNGEVWKVHRVKNKTSKNTCTALKQYKKNKMVLNHTIHYELIEKIC